MGNFSVLGLGLMGRAICYDLLTNSNKNVIGIEYHPEQIKLTESKLKRYEDRLQLFQFTLSTEFPSDVFDDLGKLLNKHNVSVVIGAIDYKFNLILSEFCIENNFSFVDLGGNPNIVKKQHLLDEEAKKANITIIPDCGLAPGMVNIIANHLISSFESVQTCSLYVGGLPQRPESILKYQQVFSIRGLTNEYLEKSVVLRGGKIQEIPSLTEGEVLKFDSPWGELEAYHTAGGTSSLPTLYEGKIETLEYKTLRYPGHFQFFRFLKEFGFLDDLTHKNLGINPRQATERLLEEHLPKNKEDAVIARIKISGNKNGNSQEETYDLIDLYDSTNKISAMERTTGYSISIIAIFIADGKINSKGVLPGESIVPSDLFIKELRHRGIDWVGL